MSKIISSCREILKQYEKEIINNLNEGLKELEEEPDLDITVITKRLEDNLFELARSLVIELFENKDKEIYESGKRLKEGWTSKKKDMNKSLITIFGEIEYQRRYYYNGSDHTYLVDDFFGIERNQRMEPMVETRLVELSTETSYKKSGKKTVKDVDISDSTVMNKVHKLEGMDEILEQKESNEEKREVDVLYIEADEDHVNLQNGKNAISKLAYVHEGYKEEEKAKKDGSKLKNVKYIAGEYNNSEEIWLEVSDYLYENYNMDKVEKIFIGGDGDPWIKEGLNWIPNSKFVLDRFHLNDYITKATVYAEEYKPKLWDALNRLDKKRLSILFSELIAKADDESRKHSIRKTRKYIYNQWDGIKNAVEDEDFINPSAEGHVSHILSDRLSSRPMGWSRKGMDQMSKLRAFKFNGGSEKDIYRLITKEKQQRQKQKVIDKIIKNKPNKEEYGEQKDNIPALSRGKVRGTYRALKGLAR